MTKQEGPILRNPMEVAKWHAFLGTILEMDSGHLNMKSDITLNSLHGVLGWVMNCPGCNEQVDALFKNLLTTTELGRVRSVSIDSLIHNHQSEVQQAYLVDEGQRQAVILALALMSLLRPGWLTMCRELAHVFGGDAHAMFENFRVWNTPMRIMPMVKVVLESEPLTNSYSVPKHPNDPNYPGSGNYGG